MFSSESILFKNAQVYDRERGKCLKNDLFIHNGTVKHLNSAISPSVIIDCSNLEIYPGLVDMQVHLREPGNEEKEDIASGTFAAVRGGFTQIACMPNTNPRLDSVPWIRTIQHKVEVGESSCEVFPIAAMTKGIKGLEICNYFDFKKNNIFAITDDGRGVQDNKIMEQIFKEAQLHGLSIMQHCEVESISNHASFHLGTFTKLHNIDGQPSSAEYEMIQRDLELVSKYKVPYHVLHLSTEEGLELVKQAKLARLPVTCEVTPHHLLLCDEDIVEPFSNFKMNPPLRSKNDQLALQKGLALGDIDIISTDHAPHTSKEKNMHWRMAPFGIIGLETAFPLLYTELYLKQKISLPRLIEAFSYKAQSIFPIGRRDLYDGGRADFFIVDPKRELTVSELEIKSKSSNSPFWGNKLFGWPIATFYKGKCAYYDERVKLKSIK